ncbi:Alpha/Beta hydrolase protein [Phyllosticta citrichinensis]|uniref:Alpha/Beta hydrolase protein n=1 Tax=Phyllosticta citrichinensis TaxID=1130410 RepID=A0ABR1XZA0_9PEZI
MPTPQRYSACAGAAVPHQARPFVIPPSHPTGRHTHTVIVLHGRGDTGSQFGSGLVSARTSSLSYTTSKKKRLAEHLRTTRFVFPTAPLVSAAAGLTQWYDNFSMTQRKEPQRAGLATTASLLARLVGGLDRVVLGGLSQGCAAALVFFLGSHGYDDGEGEAGGEEGEKDVEALGGFFGLSGWLPFADELDLSTWRDREGESAAADQEMGGDEWMPQRQAKAANVARAITSLPPLSLESQESPAFARTPVFLGHGEHDRHVEMRLGAQAGDVLVDLGCDVKWEEYDEERWWKEPEQIDDLVEFLRDAVGVETT